MISIYAKIGYATPIIEMKRTFHKGKVYGIQGVNGSGKSTLLRALSGEIAPLDGVIKIDNMSVTDKESVGKVLNISTPDFYPDLSIGEHLEILQKVTKVNFDKTIEKWQLENLLEKSPSRVSSGQQQRSFLASQLELGAKVMILDEPERHLDDFWIDTLCRELKSKALQGTTIISASHSSKILAICDEVLQLEEYSFKSN